MFERGVLDEEITIYGRSDHVCFEAVGSWGNDCRAVSGAQYQHRDALSVAHTVWRMDTSMIERLEQLEAENAHLWKMHTEKRSRLRSARTPLGERLKAI